MGHNKAGVPQGAILGPLFFLLDINYLSENIDSNPKLFEITYSYFTFNNAASSNSQLSVDLTKINYWAYKRKMSFYLDYRKPSHEVTFSFKKVKHIMFCLWCIMFLLNVFHFICIFD